MKYYFYFMCLVLCLLLTGCDIKSLRCSRTSDVGDGSIATNEFKIKFNNDKVINLSMQLDVTLKDEDETSKNSIASSVDENFGIYKNMAGVNYSSTIRDDGFNVSIVINFIRLSNKEKEKISLINPEKNYEQIKSEFVNNGFTCK